MAIRRIKMKPFFSYYGGKYRVSGKFYPPPRYDTVVEPFAGSAGYSVRHCPKKAILIDAYKPIASIWDYLIGADASRILSLPDLDGREIDDVSGLSEAERYLIGFCVHQGSETPRKRESAFGRDKDASCWAGAKRKRIASQLPLIRNWRAIHGDYRNAPDIEATWFIDPPYCGDPGRRYAENVIDYSDLRDFVMSRKGQVIVCEGAGANWLPFEEAFINNGLHNKKSKEFVYIRDSGIELSEPFAKMAEKRISHAAGCGFGDPKPKRVRIVKKEIDE